VTFEAFKFPLPNNGRNSRVKFCCVDMGNQENDLRDGDKPKQDLSNPKL
jgi:hypothetical protein